MLLSVYHQKDNNKCVRVEMSFLSHRRFCARVWNKSDQNLILKNLNHDWSALLRSIGLDWHVCVLGDTRCCHSLISEYLQELSTSTRGTRPIVPTGGAKVIVCCHKCKTPLMNSTPRIVTGDCARQPGGDVRTGRVRQIAARRRAGPRLHPASQRRRRRHDREPHLPGERMRSPHRPEDQHRQPNE